MDASRIDSHQHGNTVLKAKPHQAQEHRSSSERPQNNNARVAKRETSAVPDPSKVSKRIDTTA